MEAFLYEAAQNFDLFSNIQDQKLKNQKHIAVDVLFNAYPMTLRLIQSGRTVPLKQITLLQKMQSFEFKAARKARRH